MSDNTQRLEALYEQLDDVRATQDGIWREIHRPGLEDEEISSRQGYLTALEREEDDLLGEIESLGGEDPDA